MTMSPPVAPGEEARPRKRRGVAAFSLGTLLAVITLFCCYHAYRTNEQVRKYYTPAPVAAYSPNITPYAFTDADFVEPLDPRPATVRLTERVSVIRARVGELRSRGDAKAADAMEQALTKILANRKGPYPNDGALQLHAIGLFAGVEQPLGPKATTGEKVERIDGSVVGDAHVRVAYTGAPVTLCLCAYHPVRWILEVEPQVQIESVILAGPHRQLIEGLPADVAVEGQTRGREPAYDFYAYAPSMIGVPSQHLKKITGLSPTTFYTTPAYSGSTLVIGPEGDQWASSMTLHALDDVYQEAIRQNRAIIASNLAQESFPDIIVSAHHRSDHQYSFATQSIFGPYVSTMQPLQVFAPEMGFDPNGPTFFGWRDQLVTIDPETGATSEFVVDGLDKPWKAPKITFDSTRHRLLLWRDYDLVAIDLRKKAVLPLCEVNDDVLAIAYSKRDDRIYALCAPDYDDGHVLISEIRTYNDRGAQLSIVHLKVPLVAAAHPFDLRYLKVAMVSDKLLVMVGGEDDVICFPSHNYVLDPKTGELLFACKREPR